MISFCFFFFFSSRRRHTRFDCDWSSDVCSSDLFKTVVDYPSDREEVAVVDRSLEGAPDIERSEERRVGKSVDLGGRRIIKKKKKKEKSEREWRVVIKSIAMCGTLIGERA